MLWSSIIVVFGQTITNKPNSEIIPFNSNTIESIERVDNKIDIQSNTKKPLTLKKSIILNVLGYAKPEQTSIYKLDFFDKYVIEHKGRHWLIKSSDIEDNQLIHNRNNKIKNILDSLVFKKNKTWNTLDSLVQHQIASQNDSIINILAAGLRLDEEYDSLKTIEYNNHLIQWDKSLTANAKKAQLCILQSSLQEPNSASGCDYHFIFKNLSHKTIKYLKFEGFVYNAVGDKVLCNIKASSIIKGRETGPIKPGEQGGGTWETIIYNWAADTVKLEKISIEYMDGTTYHLQAKDILTLFFHPIKEQPAHKMYRIAKECASSLEREIRLLRLYYENIKKHKDAQSYIEDPVAKWNNAYYNYYSFFEATRKKVIDLQNEIDQIKQQY